MTMDFEKEFDYHKKHPFQSCGVLQNGQWFEEFHLPSQFHHEAYNAMES